MSGLQRVYKQRIRSTETLKKVFRAMELIAASRIGRARARAQQGTPYAQAVTKAVSALANHSTLDHPMLKRREDTNRVAVFAITADRGQAGAYSASVLRHTERTMEELRAQGKEPVLYVAGRRGLSFFRFRGVEVARSWEGKSDSPDAQTAVEMAEEIVRLYQLPAAEGGVAEIHFVFTRFVTMVRQVVEQRRMLPIEVVEGVAAATDEKPLPLYEFEPTPDHVLDRLLPLYLRSRVYSQLLHSAASELASRQRAMHTATQNAEDLIRKYTRLANTARQAEITQEISEIVSGADALAAS